MRVPQIAFMLQVKVTIDPKDRDTFIKHFKTAYNFAMAEPECAYFFVGENVQEPGAFYWTEGWTKDTQWFMTVSQTPPSGIAYVLSFLTRSLPGANQKTIL